MAQFLDPATLDKHMLVNSYIDGASPTQKDIAVFKATCPVPNAASFPHAARWYAHIKSFSDTKIASLPGKYESLLSVTAPKHSAAAAPAPAAPAPAAPAEGKGKGLCVPYA